MTKNEVWLKDFSPEGVSIVADILEDALALGALEKIGRELRLNDSTIEAIVVYVRASLRSKDASAFTLALDLKEVYKTAQKLVKTKSISARQFSILHRALAGTLGLGTELPA